MKKQIKKSTANGIIMAPPSKSYAHRAIIASSLAEGISIIDNIELSNDITATISCVKALGTNVELNQKQIIIKPRDNKLEEELIFDCFESGSTLRFMIPIALLTGKKLIFKGTKRLLSRGLSVYEEIFTRDKIKYQKTSDEIILEGTLKGGKYKVSGNISSQFITGLLFSLPLLKVDSIIEIIPPIESLAYIDMTIDVLNKFNVKVEKRDNLILIKGNQKYINTNFEVEGDYSNAAFLDAFNYLGGNVIVTGLNQNSIQGDKVYQDYFPLLKTSTPKLDISNAIDLGPILFTLATIFNGAHFIGTKRLKIKESNRVLDTLSELEKFGCKYQIFDNEVIIEKSKLHHPNSELDSHNDHRILMSLVVISSIYGGIINNTEAVNKSFPTFFEKIRQLGIEVQDDFN